MARWPGAGLLQNLRRPAAVVVGQAKLQQPSALVGEGKQGYCLNTHAEFTAMSGGGQSVALQVAGLTPASMRTELRA